MSETNDFAMHFDGKNLYCTQDVYHAKDEHLRVLEWLKDNRDNSNWNENTLLHEEDGASRILEWLKDNKTIFSLDESAYIIAAGSGNLKALQQLRDKSIQGEALVWNERIVEVAAKEGHLDILKYLRNSSIHEHANICPWDESACTVAAFYGRTDILQWLRNPTIETSSTDLSEKYTTEDSNNHSEPSDFCNCETVKHNSTAKDIDEKSRNNFEDSLPCPWNQKTCTAAVKGGHLNTLKWLLENGCPCGYDTFKYAKLGNRKDIIELLESRQFYTK